MWSQFYLPPTCFIPAKAEQYLEHYIHNELVDAVSHSTDLERMEAWVELSVPGIWTTDLYYTAWVNKRLQELAL